MWCTLAQLEPRLLLSAAYPCGYEQYMLELVNRARANPAAEVVRYDGSYWTGAPDLNEGLPAGTISPEPKQPLAFNPRLTDSAQRHAQWMLDTGIFDHTGSDGSSPDERMAEAGYAFDDSRTWAENIAWLGSTTAVPERVARPATAGWNPLRIPLAGR